MSDCRFTSKLSWSWPHPTFSGSHWSSCGYELKSVPVRFGTHWSLFRSVSVPIEVRFDIFVGPFRSVSVRRDTLSTYFLSYFYFIYFLSFCFKFVVFMSVQTNKLTCNWIKTFYVLYSYLPEIDATSAGLANFPVFFPRPLSVIGSNNDLLWSSNDWVIEGQ